MSVQHTAAEAASETAPAATRTAPAATSTAPATSTTSTAPAASTAGAVPARGAAEVIADDAEALATAAAPADEFRVGAAERDAERRLPRAELDRLSDSVLLAVTVPAEHGGADVRQETLAEVFRLLASADAGLARIPQSPFVYVNVIRRQGTEAQRAFFFGEVLAGHRFGNAQSEAGTKHVQDIRTRLERQPDGSYVLTGVQHYSTGALFADWIPVLARTEDDTLHVAYVPRDAKGLTVVDDWDGMGQRTTAGGTVRLDAVPVPADRVLPHHLTFQGPQLHGAVAQLRHAAIDAGIAAGALAEAVHFVRTKSRPWFESGAETAAEDPLLVRRFGELAVQSRATEALLGAAARPRATDSSEQPSRKQPRTPPRPPRSENAPVSLTFHWFLPTNGDSRDVVGGGHGTAVTVSGRDRPPTVAYLSQIARAAEDLGFVGALTPTGAWCEDAWLTTAMVSQNTERLKFLVAFRPGFVSPTLAAQMASTFQRQSGGRLLLNVVTGGESHEQRAYGDFLDKDARYRRTGEFLEIVRGLWQGGTVDLDGEFLKVEDARLARVPDPVPEVYFGGSSPIAGEIAAKHVDAYLTWGEPPAQVAEKIAWVRGLAEKEGRTVRFGIRLHVITRDTSEQAWAEARRLLAGFDPETVKSVQAGLARSESEGQQRMLALHGGGSSDGLEIHPNLWAGIGLVRGGAGTALVGSHDEVAERIAEYHRLGVDEFVLSGYPHLEEAYWFGEGVLPRLAAQGLWQHPFAARPAATAQIPFAS